MFICGQMGARTLAYVCVCMYFHNVAWLPGCSRTTLRGVQSLPLDSSLVPIANSPVLCSPLHLSSHMLEGENDRGGGGIYSFICSLLIDCYRIRSSLWGKMHTTLLYALCCIVFLVLHIFICGFAIKTNQSTSNFCRNKFSLPNIQYRFNI